MKLTKEYKIAIASSIVVVGVVTYILINRAKKKKQIETIEAILSGSVKDPNATNVGQKIIPTTSDSFKKLPDGVFPIKFGDKSKKVYSVQQALNRKYGTSIDLDGIYGDATFQVMCDKVWNSSLFTNKQIVCYEITSQGRERRKITQQDFELITK